MVNDDALTELALRAGAGDRDAATEFIRHTYQQVWRVLVVLSNREVAEDLAQETFARAVRSLPSFKAQAPARAWLLSIARRVAADNLRTAARRPRTESRTEFDPTLVVTGDESETVALRALIVDLDADRRLAFELTQLLGLSYAEAAQVCECPVGTVRSRVARARSDLALALELRDDRGARRPITGVSGLTAVGASGAQ
jgi:RNA polymerase sigma-70 factor (ECF subfamily)